MLLVFTRLPGSLSQSSLTTMQSGRKSSLVTVPPHYAPAASERQGSPPRITQPSAPRLQLQGSSPGCQAGPDGGETGTLSSSRAHDHQAGPAAPSRSHLVQAPASGPYNSQTHDKEGISCTSFYALAATPFGSKSGLPRAIPRRAPFLPLSHSKYTAMPTKGLMVNWEFQLLHLI